jgi:hypothetical protein
MWWIESRRASSPPPRWKRPIERAEGDLAQAVEEDLPGKIRAVLFDEFAVTARRDPLHRPVEREVEGGPEGRMPGDERRRGAAQRGHVEPPEDAGGARDHIGGVAGSQAVQEPERPLTIGEGDACKGRCRVEVAQSKIGENGNHSSASL